MPTHKIKKILGCRCQWISLVVHHESSPSIYTWLSSRVQLMGINSLLGSILLGLMRYAIIDMPNLEGGIVAIMKSSKDSMAPTMDYIKVDGKECFHILVFYGWLYVYVFLCVMEKILLWVCYCFRTLSGFRVIWFPFSNHWSISCNFQVS